MTGRVTMLNISRWTLQGGSYRTIQRFFNTVAALANTLLGCFSAHICFDLEEWLYHRRQTKLSRSKSGSPHLWFIAFLFLNYTGKAIPGLSFLAVSIVSIKKRCSYPMVIEQIIRDDTSSEPTTSAPHTTRGLPETTTKHPRGRPKGSRNRNKDDIVLTDDFETASNDGKVRIATDWLATWSRLRYFVLDGYFRT